jgi:[acyl-carrier-protein] S-malonyltransferase
MLVLVRAPAAPPRPAYDIRGGIVRTAVLFPGQGSQYVGMADPWLQHPAGKEVLGQASDLLGWDVATRSRDPEALALTEVVQPAVFACDLAAGAVLRADGVTFAAAAGHSLGEYAALVLAGALTLQEALRVLVVRAGAMGEASRQRPGAMTALLGLSGQEAHDVCQVAGRGDVLAVANENGPKQIVLSGSLAAVERAEALARSRGGKAKRLQVAGAFHSPLMREALQPVREALSRVQFRTPAFPVVSNVTGRPTSRPLALRDLLSRHLVSPVRWDASMRAMGDMGVEWFLEAGPGDVLGKLARRAVPEATVRTVGSPEESAGVAADLRRDAAAGAVETEDDR